MKQNNLLKVLLLGMVCSFMQISAMDDVVTLKSADGQDFQIEVVAAKQSETLKNLIEDAGIGQSIPLSNISGKTLDHLVPLMKKVYEMQAKNEKVDMPEEYRFVPRAYQPFVNDQLKKVSITEVVQLYYAANFLDSRLILNAVAVVIADRIREDMRDDALLLFFGELGDDKDDKKETVVAELKKRIDLDVGMIQKNIWPYIGKHLQLRKCGIKLEYSIADYIKEHGQPPKARFRAYSYTVDLGWKGLTSLFGIGLLSNPTKIDCLLLYRNCFIDFSLDAQGQDKPFIGFDNITHLTFRDNRLRTLPGGMLTDLPKLGYLLLERNRFDEEQKALIRKALSNVDIEFNM